MVQSSSKTANFKVSIFFLIYVFLLTQHIWVPFTHSQPRLGMAHTYLIRISVGKQQQQREQQLCNSTHEWNQKCTVNYWIVRINVTWHSTHQSRNNDLLYIYKQKYCTRATFRIVNSNWRQHVLRVYKLCSIQQQYEISGHRGKIRRLRTPIWQAFSYGIRHILIVIHWTMSHSSLNNNEIMPYPLWKYLPYGSPQPSQWLEGKPHGYRSNPTSRALRCHNWYNCNYIAILIRLNISCHKIYKEQKMLDYRYPNFDKKWFLRMCQSLLAA